MGDYPACGGKQFAVICVGNKLMMDEGIGAAVYEALMRDYLIPENVHLYDVGCMSMDMLPYVRDCDFLISVDAVDGTGKPAGTVFRFKPEDVARHAGAMSSLHDLKLIDLFDTAELLGYKAEGLCLGMQVLNMYPSEYCTRLTEPVQEALPLLVETVVAELAKRGAMLTRRDGAMQ